MHYLTHVLHTVIVHACIECTCADLRTSTCTMVFLVTNTSELLTPFGPKLPGLVGIEYILGSLVIFPAYHSQGCQGTR